MSQRESIRKMLTGEFVDYRGEKQITLSEQGDIETLPVKVSLEGGKFHGQKFGGTLALATANGGYDVSGFEDEQVPQNNRMGVELEATGTPEVVVFEDVDVPLSTPDSEVLLLYNGGVEGWAVLARATREELIRLDERNIPEPVQRELNAVRTQVAELQRQVNRLKGDVDDIGKDSEPLPVNQTKVVSEDETEEIVEIGSQFLARTISGLI